MKAGFGSTKVENKVTPHAAPLSLATHDALVEVRRHLREGELLFAYLEDVYVVSKPDRTRALYDLLADRLHTMAGMKGKLARGTLPESALPAWPSWGLMCGASVG